MAEGSLSCQKHMSDSECSQQIQWLLSVFMFPPNSVQVDSHKTTNKWKMMGFQVKITKVHI